MDIDEFAKELVFDLYSEAALEHAILRARLDGEDIAPLQIFKTLLDPYFNVSIPASFLAACITKAGGELNPEMDFGEHLIISDDVLSQKLTESLANPQVRDVIEQAVLRAVIDAGVKIEPD